MGGWTVDEGGKTMGGTGVSGVVIWESRYAGFNRSTLTESCVPFLSRTKNLSERDNTLYGPLYGA